METELEAASHLYSAANHPEYPEKVVAWAHEHGWLVHGSQHRHYCSRTFVNPSHLCSHDDRSRENLPTHWNLDHMVLLRQGPARSPRAWALLSQPYDLWPGDVSLGLAPYGLGTHALLYTRHDVDPHD